MIIMRVDKVCYSRTKYIYIYICLVVNVFFSCRAFLAKVTLLLL